MIKPTSQDIVTVTLNLSEQKLFKQKEAVRRYHKTEKGKKALADARRNYQKTEKGKEAIRKYQKTEKGKETQRKYNESEKGKEAQRKWRQTPAGKLKMSEYNRKQRLARKNIETKETPHEFK